MWNLITFLMQEIQWEISLYSLHTVSPYFSWAIIAVGYLLSFHMQKLHWGSSIPFMQWLQWESAYSPCAISAGGHLQTFRKQELPYMCHNSSREPPYFPLIIIVVGIFLFSMCNIKVQWGMFLLPKCQKYSGNHTIFHVK